ncbi:MAG: hypothetical protein ABIU05_04820, partial [Nitrospirales bacterium]
SMEKDQHYLNPARTPFYLRFLCDLPCHSRLLWSRFDRRREASPMLGHLGVTAVEWRAIE